jgi:hypothetical protein
MKRKIVFSFFIGLSWAIIPKMSFAQEYAYECGAIGGISFYMGDANRSHIFLNPGVAIGGIYRYNVNFHWAIKGDLLAGTVSGNTADSQNVFPSNAQASFKRTFAELGGQFEFNFLPYSDKYSYLGTKPYTPYLFTGVGATVATGDQPFFNANIPIGIGFKYKLRNRLNLGLEFSMRKLFGDNFDAPDKNQDFSLDAPFGIKSSVLKNQDWYSLTLVFITWEFGLKDDPCHGM